MVLGAKIAAASCLDLISAPELLRKVKEDFRETKERMETEA